MDQQESESFDRCMLELIAVRQENAALKTKVAELTSHNSPIMPVCPHAKVKWIVCDCAIKNSLAYDFHDCNGAGTYDVPGNSGFGYSRQCGKVDPGKPA